MTGNIHLELNGSILNTHQLYFSIDLAQAPLYRFECLQNTGLQVIGMQRIQKEQVADDWVLAEPVDSRDACCSFPESKTSSIIRSSPVRWTSIRSCTSSRVATFEPPPGIWSSSPTRVPSFRIFS
jgi:hypothetical protein